MRSIPDQEQLAILHRLDHQAAQRRDALLQRRAGDQARSHVFGQTCLQLPPEALVGPRLHLLFQRDLQVVAATGVRTLAAQHETAFVVGVDQFVVDRWRV
ncbi:hypothetical protein D3C71_1764710 [compost metagenome]